MSTNNPSPKSVVLETSAKTKFGSQALVWQKIYEPLTQKIPKLLTKGKSLDADCEFNTTIDMLISLIMPLVLRGCYTMTICQENQGCLTELRICRNRNKDM